MNGRRGYQDIFMAAAFVPDPLILGFNAMVLFFYLIREGREPLKPNINGTGTSLSKKEMGG